MSYSEDWAQRFAAYGWHVQKIDGMDGGQVAAAIAAAQADPRPSIIGCRTIIGYGSPNKQGTFKSHGAPLGDEELKLTKENLGWPVEPRLTTTPTSTSPTLRLTRSKSPTARNSR